jgi:RNA polymerase sigma-70 factor (ECF subfamily)
MATLLPDAPPIGRGVSCGATRSAAVVQLQGHRNASHEADASLTGTVARTRRNQSGEWTEADAIRLAQQGNAEAFEFIYRMHSRRVYALCLRMVGNTAEAEDLAQEAFLQLFRKIQTFRGESAFSTWLHRLSVNVVLMKLRKKSLPETSLEEMTEPDEESAGPRKDVGSLDPTLVGSIDRLNLERAVDQLPPGYKQVFVLHDVQGYEHNEIAKMMGCSIGNSKSQLHKARLRLRELLQEAQREKARQERAAARDQATESGGDTSGIE